jgi:hypothetical protein
MWPIVIGECAIDVTGKDFSDRAKELIVLGVDDLLHHILGRGEADGLIILAECLPYALGGTLQSRALIQGHGLRQAVVLMGSRAAVIPRMGAAYIGIAQIKLSCRQAMEDVLFIENLRSSIRPESAIRRICLGEDHRPNLGSFYPQALTGICQAVI